MSVSARSALAAALLFLSLLLSGCGAGQEERRFAAFSEALAAEESFSFRARLRAEYAEKTLAYTLRCECAPEGDCVEILAPEEIAGVKVRLSKEGSRMEFEDLIVDTGPLDPYGLTPLNALPRLAQALREGQLDTHWTEGELLVCHLILDDHLSATVWFGQEPMTPVRAELQSDETVHIFCEIEDWS